MNVLLYLMWLFQPATYTEMVKGGAPCYVYVDVLHSGAPRGEQPACFYDPSNVNPAE
ncbi:MAG TPA: hypothetical protein VN736_29375 [Candidatus Limnocylindrales bacterium]|nr:hypothetical protein [Candidatus Limnocylindrales bacterium]